MHTLPASLRTPPNTAATVRNTTLAIAATVTLVALYLIATRSNSPAAAWGYLTGRGLPLLQSYIVVTGVMVVACAISSVLAARTKKVEVEAEEEKKQEEAKTPPPQTPPPEEKEEITQENTQPKVEILNIDEKKEAESQTYEVIPKVTQVGKTVVGALCTLETNSGLNDQQLSKTLEEGLNIFATFGEKLRNANTGNSIKIQAPKLSLSPASWLKSAKNAGIDLVVSQLLDGYKPWKQKLIETEVALFNCQLNNGDQKTKLILGVQFMGCYLSLLRLFALRGAAFGSAAKGQLNENTIGKITRDELKDLGLPEPVLNEMKLETFASTLFQAMMPTLYNEKSPSRDALAKLFKKDSSTPGDKLVVKFQQFGQGNKEIGELYKEFEGLVEEVTELLKQLGT